MHTKRELPQLFPGAKKQLTGGLKPTTAASGCQEAPATPVQAVLRLPLKKKKCDVFHVTLTSLAKGYSHSSGQVYKVCDFSYFKFNPVGIPIFFCKK